MDRQPEVTILDGKQQWPVPDRGVRPPSTWRVHDRVDVFAGLQMTSITLAPPLSLAAKNSGVNPDSTVCGNRPRSISSDTTSACSSAAGPHDRRLPGLLLRVDVRFVSKRCCHRSNRACAPVKPSSAASRHRAGSGICIGRLWPAAVQRVPVTVFAGQHQRLDAVLILYVRCTALEQLPRDVESIMPDHLMQRRHSIGLNRVDLQVRGLQEHLHLIPVLRLCRIGKCCFGSARRAYQRDQQAY